MSAPLRKDADPRLQLAVGELGRTADRPAFPYLSQAPLAVEVPEKGIVWANVSGTRRLYTKLDGALYYVNLTAA